MDSEWKLVSSKLTDGTECLILLRKGKSFCEYTKGRFENWHQYFSSFPKIELTTREACIENAEHIAGHLLEIESES